MPSHKSLTDIAVTRLMPPVSGQTDHFDRQYPGLVLRVSYRGRKTWNYLYRINGKLRRLTLDTYPPMTVADAHDAWRQARDIVRSGRDPAAGVGGMGAVDFRSVMTEWLERDQAGNKSAEIVRKKLEKNVLPFWEHRPIASIGRRDVLDVIDAVADRGAIVQARRVHAYLHRLFAWAQGRGIIESNPLASLPKPGSETKRDRVLTDSELAAVWNAASELSYPYGPVVRLLILTGARREEIAQLRWSEIGPDKIELKGDRTKNGEPHTIPLSAPARSILETVPRFSGSDWVFTISGKKPATNWALAKVKLDQTTKVEGWVIHDLRRTAATGLQKLGVQLQVTEACLGHTGGSRAGVVGIYQRHDYANEKRAALEAWGQHVMALVEGRTANVVPMVRAGQ